MTPSSFWKTTLTPASRPARKGPSSISQGNGEAYTVEFFDENWDTIEDALFKDFLPSQLKKK